MRDSINKILNLHSVVYFSIKDKKFNDAVNTIKTKTTTELGEIIKVVEEYNRSCPNSNLYTVKELKRG